MFGQVLIGLERVRRLLILLLRLRWRGLGCWRRNLIRNEAGRSVREVGDEKVRGKVCRVTRSGWTMKGEGGTA